MIEKKIIMILFGNPRIFKSRVEKDIIPVLNTICKCGCELFYNNSMELFMIKIHTDDDADESMLNTIRDSLIDYRITAHIVKTVIPISR